MRLNNITKNASNWMVLPKGKEEETARQAEEKMNGRAKLYLNLQILGVNNPQEILNIIEEWRKLSGAVMA